MSQSRRGLIISNCQAQPLKHILSLFCRTIRFDGFGVHLLSPDTRSEAIRHFLETDGDKYEVVLTIRLSDEFDAISTSQIRDTFSGRLVATIPNFYFNGLHPDLTYIGGLGHRIVGPLADYHSKLAIIAYVAGISPAETIRLFSDDTYRRLGYYQEYDRSMAELARRDADLSVTFTEETATLLRKDLCFFSVNHPTSYLLGHFCAKLRGWLEARGLATSTEWLCEPSGLPNHLAQAVVFPIYPEVAAAFNLPYPGSYNFKPATVGDTPVSCFNLGEFIELEHQSLSIVQPKVLLESGHLRGFLTQGLSELELPGPEQKRHISTLEARTGQVGQGNSPSELRFALRLDRPERLIAVDASTLLLNAAAFGPGESREVDAQVRNALDEASARTNTAGCGFRPSSSLQFVNDDVLQAIGDPRLDRAALDRLRSLLANYVVQTREMKGQFWAPDPYPKFNLSSQHSVLRYGNVELRVIENYLTERAALRDALDRIIGALSDETSMYSGGRPSNYLSADDLQWNLRALMTNAGFYVKNDPAAAWSALEQWAERYLTAIRSSHLATYPPAYPFFFGVQRAIWEAWGEAPKYVSHPTVFDLFRDLAQHSVLFMTPLANFVAQQMDTGRLYRLFKEFRPPQFSLRTLPAWISTWPNRPHSDWVETFTYMCKAVDLAFDERPFDIFLASCGCYGLPICDYARSKHGCRTVYLGNITNAYFGVRQSATRDFMRDQVNPDMWIDGDLSQYRNIDRIDAGRYV